MPRGGTTIRKMVVCRPSDCSHCRVVAQDSRRIVVCRPSWRTLLLTCAVLRVGRPSGAWMAVADVADPLRTRAGVRRRDGADLSHGRRRSSATGGVGLGGPSDVSARVSVSSAGKFAPGPKRRRHACHQRPTSAPVAPVAGHYSHRGFGSRSPGRRSTLRRSNAPCGMGRSSLRVFQPGTAAGVDRRGPDDRSSISLPQRTVGESSYAPRQGPAGARVAVCCLARGFARRPRTRARPVAAYQEAASTMASAASTRSPP